MELLEISYEMSELVESSKNFCYLRTEPEVLDFTSKTSGKIILQGEKKSVSLEISPKNVLPVLGLLSVTVFDKDQVPTLLCWDLKSLLSYFHFFVKKEIEITSNVIDIRVLENFLNIRKEQPKKILEAVNRCKTLIKLSDSWKPLYKKIHLPLMMKVLPSLETTPLVDVLKKESVYAHYDIEGQINGRMNSYKKFDKSFLPYTMSPEVKENLRPRGYGLIFLIADYQACEVAVLQWLSGDKALKSILESGKDLHKEIYHVITNNECDNDNKRKISKRIFLPTIYGMGSTGLSKSIGVSQSLAKEIIRRVEHVFKDAFEWICSKEKEAEKGEVKDLFGRPRVFKEGEAYLARNFSVQGVAATACQEKLILLNQSLELARLCFSVHDGYGLICGNKVKDEVAKAIRGHLESESELCNGLKMKVEIRFGEKLSNLSVQEIDANGNK